MIKSFKHEGLKRLYQKGDPSLIGANIRGVVEEILSMLDEAVITDDLDLPGYRLHPLKGPPERVLVDDGERQLAHHFPVGWAMCTTCN